MANFPSGMQKLIRELTRLPSIGEKSATRLAYHLVTSDKKQALSLAKTLSEAVEQVRLCQYCFHLSEEDTCSICLDPRRDKSLLCVVEKPSDVLAIERVGEYRGLYHVLHGVWAPLRGQGPDSIRLTECVERLKAGGIQELILATSATVEGDATALYLARLVSNMGVKISRLAQGIPKGGELEYADDVTLSRAFAGRSLVSG
jgi:recombination protein RecR